MKSIFNLIISIFIITTFLSCYEKVEACLDESSTNFNIDTDISCEDCCVYPSMSLTVNHMMGSETHNPNSAYINNFSQIYRLKSAYFFMQDFKFTFEVGNQVGIIEVADFQNDLDETVQLKDDYIIIKTGESSRTLGTLRKDGKIEQVQYQLGIHENVTSLDENHILNRYDSLYVDQQYINAVFHVEHLTSQIEDKRLEFAGTNHIILGEKDVNIEKLLRTSLNIQMLIDYREVLDNIDLENLHSETLFEQISAEANFITFK